MDSLSRAIDFLINRVLWTTPTFVAMLATGVVFTIWSRFVQWRALTHGVQVTRGKYDDKSDPGAINHFQALAAALSGTTGLGNVGGVALAIAIGGPGALFWMWMTGFFGMAIKTVEVTLAMIYRDTSDPDRPTGGAMYVLQRGWGDHAGPFGKVAARVLGSIFCVTLFISTMTGGNMFQSWNVADITHQYFNVPPIVTGILLAVATGVVIIGGIKRIGDVAGYLVPIMCGVYMIAGIVVLIVQAANVPALLWLIVKSAFSPTEAAGAFLGATTWFGLTTGLRRALFSNEAGQGTSPIAHCAAKTSEPVREGVVAGLEPFIDTCVVCTLTALVILSTGTWNRAPLGEFDGEPGVETRVEALPPQPGGEPWVVDQKFYLIAESAEAQANTGEKRVRLTGKIASIDGEPTIEWEALPAGAAVKDLGIHRDLIGSAMTGLAFDRAVPGLGKYLVTLTCWLFGFATLISWSYYGEQASVFLFGPRAALPYKFIFCFGTVAITFPRLISTDAELGNLSDLGTGCMLFANVPVLWFMGYRAIAALRDYFRRLDAGEMRPPHAAPPIAEVMSGDDVS